MNKPSNESMTLLRVRSNTAVKLQGASRTVSGAVVGYVGVRVFQPMPVSKTVESLGGARFLLVLVAMATDVEFMYAAVKCLACVLKSNA
ncbi:WD repeat and FYVE domain-containing 3 isoform X2 [Brachionus plicatilis]|uniref:WD repeat and FYVE domain-containing 3 isoform X2 n=1 Tax=Brachionus plicatilis TaxID=10195 RepID=A0A3M7S6V3_BRAPC|nr:WD repeat and FYVE domain-containing 3 isoform X2 [Brachionus plicatilis]